MRALRKIHPGAGGVQLCDVPVPEPAADEIRIKVAYVGICGTDMHIISDEYPANMPVTMGHEYSGVVDMVGDDVVDFRPGDKVISMTVGYACGKCRSCHEGLELKCSQRRSIGSGMDGAMAEYVVVKASRAFRIPGGIPMEIAALAEPVSCCVRSVVEVSKIRAGDYVYVSGPGVMGQLVAQLAKIAGAHVTLGGTDADAARLELARSLGVDETVVVTQMDVAGLGRQLTEGEGFDLAYECAGVRPSADTCIEVLRPLGQYVQVCLFGKAIPFDMDGALIGEKHIVSSFAAERSSFEITLRLLKEGKLELEPYISAIYPLEQWEKAIADTAAKSGYKVLMRPYKENFWI